MRVTIKDDTLRANGVMVITPQMRDEAAKAGRPIPSNVRFLLAKDKQGRQIQKAVTVERVLEGEHLDHALRRARRYMRSRRFRRPGSGVPRHIALFMAALAKVDPEGFKRALA